jgi:transcriptional antiterminator RfaH
MLPLFPGYMFLHGDDHQRVEAMQWNHLANILNVVDQEAFERDLRQVHQLLSTGLPVAPEPCHVVGSTIRIMSGPLKGVVGTVVRRGGHNRFTALVRFLGRGATIELQDWQVQSCQYEN